MHNPYIPISPVTSSHLFLSLFSKRGRYTLINPEEKIGVLITVFNEGESIKETLNSVLHQSYPPNLVIVSEHGSTDNSRKCIEEHLSANKYDILKDFSSKEFKEVSLYRNATKPKILLAVGKKRMSKAEGVNALKEEGFVNWVDWIITIDSDTILSPNFLEELQKNVYKIRIVNKEIVITQNTILGAVVMPRENKKAGLIEKLIAKAREAEYAFGQILIRSGQNWTALYVAPGCGFMCWTEKYHFPNKTVTEDLELTQTVQSKSEKFEISRPKISEFSKEMNNFQVIVGDNLNRKNRIPFDEFVHFFRLGGKANKISIKYNHAYFVSNAIMYTQEPHSLKSLVMQLDRWTRGFHQIMSLKSKQFRKRKKLAWTVYGARYEGLLSSLIYLGIPLFLFLYLLFGFGIKPKYLVTFLAADFLIQYTLVLIAIYRRFRIEGKRKIFLKAVKNAALDMIPWYILRGFNSFQFLKTFIATSIDTKIKKIQNWSKNALWERPKEVR